MEDQLIHSFLVDKEASNFGFTCCAPGRQPKVVVPPFFPDKAKPYITETEAKILFDRFDKISKTTGAPFFPMIGIPFFILIFIPLTGIAIGIVMFTMTFIIIFGTIWSMASKRKTEMKNLLEEWNRTEGKPRGIYFAFGTENGVSPDDFFNDRRTTGRRFGDRRSFTVKTRYVCFSTYDICFFKDFPYWFMFCI